MVFLRCFFLLPVLVITACARTDGPVPQDKPTAPPRPPFVSSQAPDPVHAPGRGAFLDALNDARLSLALHDADVAARSLSRLKHLAGIANRASPEDSELSAKIIYIREGTLNTLLVGLHKGKTRYDAMVKVLKALSKGGIEPKEVVLVRLPTGLGKAVIQAQLREAEAIMKRLDATAPQRAFIEADRALEKLYLAMEPKAFDDLPEIRLQLYLWLSRELLMAKYYALSSDALALARAACEDYALQQNAPSRENVAAYRNEIASLEKALKHRDPDMLGKLGDVLREAWYNLQN